MKTRLLTHVLAAAAGGPLWLPLALLLSCGLRRGEVCGLRWSDLDLRRNLIHVQNQRMRVRGKGLIDSRLKSESSYRDIPIPKMLMEALAEAEIVQQAEALLGGQKCPYVLAGPTGRGYDPNRLSRDLQAHFRACGVRCTVHGLRHTMATIGSAAGVPMRILQALLGHSSYTTTARYYAHASDRATRTGIETIQKHLTLNQGVPGSSP